MIGRWGAAVVAVATMCTALFTGTAAAAQDPVPPAGALIKARAVGGNGCPAGQTDVRPDPDARGVNYRFHAFVLTDATSASCTIVLAVTAPAGWQFAVDQWWLYGDLILPADAKAQLRTYATIGDSDVTTTGTPRRFAGPRDGQWAHTPRMSFPAFTGRCGGTEDVRLVLSAVLPPPAAQGSRFALAGASLELRDFAWRAC